MVLWFECDTPPTDQFSLSVKIGNQHGEVLSDVIGSELRGTNPYSWATFLPELREEDGPYLIQVGLAKKPPADERHIQSDTNEVGEE